PFRPVRAVALVANQDLPQCRLYRVDQKLEQLRHAGYAVGLYDFHSALPAFLDDIYRYDAVIFYRVPALPAVIGAIAKARELGLITFYEIDDLIFDADEYPSSLASYDGQIGAEEYAGLKLGVPLFAHALSLCDFALASTPPLAEQMARHVVGRAFVHPNALGRCHEAAIAQLPTSRSGERVTVFYGSGTKAHKEDFQELIEPALVELVRRHGDRVAIVLMGYITMTDRLRSIEDHLLLIDPNWDANAYWAVLSQVDINIAVLKPSPMADCKSEIKWLEAAMFGIPSIVSDTATFRTVVEPGVTGFLCRTPADWTAALGRLVADDGLRRQVGQQARERAIAAYGMPAMGDNLQRMLSEVSPAPADAKPTILIVNVFYPPQAIGGATRV
ncbi:MAG: glycosyltransferase, partial [Alphaproteobacteria bacterium]